MTIGLSLESPVSLVIQFYIVGWFLFGIGVCLVYDLLHVDQLHSVVAHLLPDPPTLLLIVIRLLKITFKVMSFTLIISERKSVFTKLRFFTGFICFCSKSVCKE